MNEDGYYSQPVMCIMEWLSTSGLFLEPAFLALWLFWEVSLEAAMPNVILTPWLQSWARMENLSQCFHPREFVTGMNKSQAFQRLSNLSFHSCRRSCVQPNGPDAEVSIKESAKC